MNANMNGGTVGLFTLNALDVHNKFASVTFEDLSGLLSLVVTSGDHDLIVLADRNAANVVFFSQLFAQRRAHDLSSDVRRGSEVTLSILSSRAAN